MGDIAGALDGKDEAIRNLRRPFAKGRRCLRAIEGAVDLDRGEVARRVAQLLRMGQAVGVEHAPPRRKGPTADADVDVCGGLIGFRHVILSVSIPATLNIFFPDACKTQIRSFFWSFPS